MRYPGVLEGNQNIHHLSFLAINREITISILKVMANVQGRAASNFGVVYNLLYFCNFDFGLVVKDG